MYWDNVTLKEFLFKASQYKYCGGGDGSYLQSSFFRALYSIYYHLPIDNGHWRAIFFNLNDDDFVLLKKCFRDFWSSCIGKDFVLCLVREKFKYFIQNYSSEILHVICKQLTFFSFPQHFVFFLKHVRSIPSLFVTSVSSALVSAIILESVAIKSAIKSTSTSVIYKPQSLSDLKKQSLDIISWPNKMLIDFSNENYFENEISWYTKKIKCEYFGNNIEEQDDNFSSLEMMKQRAYRMYRIYRMFRVCKNMRIINEKRLLYNNKIYFYIRKNNEENKIYLLSNDKEWGLLHVECDYINSTINNQIFFKIFLKKNIMEPIFEEI